MRIVATGSNGRVGQYLMHRGVLPFSADVTDLVDVDREMNRLRPDIVLHLAAKSDVDWCEKKENSRQVDNVNVFGTFNVCEMAEKYKAQVVLLSSGYVFSGKRWWGKYDENSSILNPSNTYGFSKCSAEGFQYNFDNLKIIRTSYLFDYRRLALDINKLKCGVPRDFPTFLKRSFLYLPHFIDMLMVYCSHFDRMPPILHLSGCDAVSWYEFMRDVARAYRIDPNLPRPRRKDLKNGYANRGYRLGLDTRLSEQLGFPRCSYKDGLKEMVLRA